MTDNLYHPFRRIVFLGIIFVIFISLQLISLLAGGAEISRGKTWYVNNVTGNDGFSGTPRSPFATLRKAEEVTHPGDIVVIQSNGKEHPYKETLSITRSGTSDGWITFRGEDKSSRPVIIGKLHGVYIGGVHYIRLENLAITDIKKTGSGVYIDRGASDIEIYGIDIDRSNYNGIKVQGAAANIEIVKCNIRNCRNNGIIIMGDPVYHTRNTLIKDSRISNVERNDCISLHKDLYGNGLGAGHQITGTTTTQCGEQGIDITSGSDVLISGNTTSGSHDSGLLIDHGVRDIRIVNHISMEEGRQAGILVRNAENVSLGNSIFYAPVRNPIFLKDVRGFSALHNTVILLKNCKGPLIHIEDHCSGTSFRRNVFYSRRDRDDRLLRVKNCSLLNGDVQFDENIWWSHQWDRKVFLKAGEGRFDFSHLQWFYNQGGNGKFLDPELSVGKGGLVINKNLRGYGASLEMGKRLAGIIATYGRVHERTQK